MTIIDSKTIVVFSAAELKQYLEAENTYTYFYLGNNITLTSGITISKTKTAVTIDGTYLGTKYTYEDIKSLSTGDTISIQNSNNKNVTIKNLTVIGHNYYGIVYVPETSTMENSTIEYQNITYEGPQITFNPMGISRYIDCKIKIITSYAEANEVAECNRIEIGGTTTIEHNSTIDTMFWFRGNQKPYLKFLENSKVTLTSAYRELFYGVNNLDFQIMKNANVTITTANGMGYANYSTDSVLIEEQASLNLTQTKANGSYPTWYTTGSFTMNPNSSLQITDNYTGIGTNNYSLYFGTSSASLTLNQPKLVAIYNQKAQAIYTNATIKFNFTYSRLNMWEKANTFTTAGTLSDLPPYYWYKETENSIVSGTFTSSLTTITSQNYTSEELNILPPLSNFNFQNKCVFSIGTVTLSPHLISNKSQSIRGTTNPLAQVKITIETNSSIVTADNNGVFTFPLENTLAIGTTVTLLANLPNKFVYWTKTMQVLDNGNIILTSATTAIPFSLIPFSTSPLLCPKLNPLIITVEDQRIESSNWKLYATINHDLETTNGHKLTQSLVYINDSQNITPLSTIKTLVYTGKDSQGITTTTTINWEENQAIVLNPQTEPIHTNETYQATITWTLEE